MSRSLRTIPAGALAACALVLLTAPQAGAAGRAARPDATAPRPAVSARAHPPGHAERGRPALRPHHGWGEAWTRHHRADHHRTDRDRDKATADARPPRDQDDDASAPVRRPHGVPGESPAPSGAPHASADHDTGTSAHGAGAEGTHAAGGPVWPAPVAPPADPLIDSEVWRPADPAPGGQAMDGTRTRAVGPSASSPAATAPVLPVLTFGAGLTSLGLGIAFFALRLRRG